MCNYDECTPNNGGSSCPGSGGASVVCVRSVSVSPGAITLKVGSWSYDASAVVSPSNATNKQVRWHSSDPSVASVGASSGYIYANAVGTARIYATATDGSGCSDYLTVTVSNKVPVASITLNHSSVTIQKGYRAWLSAVVCPDNATNKELNWTSSNSSVATVCDGVVRAMGKGSASITATATDGSGKSASCSVSVTEDVLVSSICFDPDPRQMRVGDSAYFNASSKTNEIFTVVPFTN